MKISHRLLILVVLSLVMTQLLLYSLTRQKEIQVHSQTQFEHVAKIEQQLELVRSRLWQMSIHADQKSIAAIRIEQQTLTSLLSNTQIDLPEQELLVNTMISINEGIGSLLNLSEQALSSTQLLQLSPDGMLMARYGLAFQSMTEAIFQYQRSVIIFSADQQQTYLYINGAAMLLFTLTLVAVATRTYSQFSQNLTQLNKGIAALAKGDMKSQIHLPHNDELARLGREFNQMKASLEQTTVQKDELSNEVAKQTQQLQRQQEKLRYLADHDDLTGLFSRSAFNNLLEVCLLRCQRYGDKAGLLFVDLDKFKPVNDTYGHAAGDTALVEISDRMKELLRKSDVIARFGGDEFVILVEPVRHHDELMNLANKLQTSLSHPIHYQGVTLELGVSVGISVYPHDGVTAQELILNADDAMYKAKKSGGKACFFASAIS
ncbi:diguanylate cyclase [Shewanella corallii]|uniref:Diguanylate cyclase n=1 Tax=Shewanella corallii TaxID=560080 RepID=A0ABT0NBM3_9GAMM|nr:diguanylate cyclase [Shewanella corallii]MCL2915780.1 diguanylate cyclase [Shewanella corallii]